MTTISDLTGSDALAIATKAIANGAAANLVYQAVGDGTANDSPVVTAAIIAARNVVLAPGKSYALKDIALSNSQSVQGFDTPINAFSGATHIFTLSDYSPSVTGLYIADNRNSSAAAIAFKTSRFAYLVNTTIVDAVNGVSFANDGATGCNKPRVSDVDIEEVSGIGVDVGSSVTQLRWTIGSVAGLVDYVLGLGKPRVGSIGWRQHTTVVGGLAVGGHQILAFDAEGLDTGYDLFDAQLSTFTSVVADACSSYGVKALGACDKLTFNELWCTFSAGIYIGGGSFITINGLQTYNNGEIPSWGAANWYQIAGPYYDLQVRDTASVVVRSWRGSKRIAVDSTAKLVYEGGGEFEGKSVGTVAAGYSGFLGAQGNSVTELDCEWRAPYDCYLLRICPTATVAPSGSETFTYKARVAGVDTALTKVLTGSGFGGTDAWAGSLIPVSEGTAVSISLAVSSGAAAARHTCIIQYAPQ